MQIQDIMHTEILKRVSRESLTILVLSASLFLAAFCTKELVSDQLARYKEKSRELSSYRELISSENGYSQIRSEIEKKNTLLQEKLNSRIGNQADSAGLSSFLETLIAKARASDIRFVKMQPQAESRNEDFVLFPVILDMTTTYHALGQFISSLEKIPFMFKIERLAMESKPEGGIEAKILVTCFIPLQNI